MNEKKGKVKGGGLIVRGGRAQVMMTDDVTL